MFNSYIAAWKRPFDFKGKSNRKEYWSFNLLSFFPFVFFNLIESLIDTFRFSLVSNSSGLNLIPNLLEIISKTINIFSSLLIFGFLWTCIPLTVRRIRDIGMSWKWIFFALTPYAGNVFALIFLSRPSLISIGEKEYYLKYPTKKRDIWLIGALGFFAIPLLFVLLLISIPTPS